MADLGCRIRGTPKIERLLEYEQIRHPTSDITNQGAYRKSKCSNENKSDILNPPS